MSIYGQFRDVSHLVMVLELVFIRNSALQPGRLHQVLLRR